MNVICAIALERGLKLKKTFDPSKIESLPNAFGAFVGVYRLKKDVHGCIGNWDDAFKILSPQELISIIIKVSISATHEDDRKNNFKHSIYTDPNAYYEVYFMTNQKKVPNNYLEDNSLFDNNKYGLIARSQNGRATFLPDVFDKITWGDIKNELQKKAGIQESEFYIYETINCKLSILDYFITPFVKLINKLYLSEKFVPYSIEQNRVIVERNQNIRNLGLIHTLLKLRNHNYPLKINEINDNLKLYIDKFYKNSYQMRQASAFLLLCLYETKEKIYESTIKDIIVYLYNELENAKDIDNKFELGEIIMSLGIVQPRDVLINYLDRFNLETSQNIDSIFEYNWLSQSLLVLSYNKYDVKKYADKLNKLINKYIEYYMNDTLETNYLAVIFEAITALHSFGYNHDVSIESLMRMLSRRNKKGIYYFKNGEARFDITGHVIDGYFNLLKPNMYGGGHWKYSLYDAYLKYFEEFAIELL